MAQEENFLGKGWPFPLKAEGHRRLNLVGGAEKIRQSIWLILSTAPGERQMRPEFGCNIHDLVFQPNTTTLHGLVQARVYDALVQWEPRVDILDVRVETAEEAGNTLFIRIDYRIRSNNAFYNLVYPLSLIHI